MLTHGRKLVLGNPWSVTSVQWASWMQGWGTDLTMRKCKSFYFANDFWKISNLILERKILFQSFPCFDMKKCLKTVCFSFSTVSFFFFFFFVFLTTLSPHRSETFSGLLPSPQPSFEWTLSTWDYIWNMSRAMDANQKKWSVSRRVLGNVYLFTPRWVHSDNVFEMHTCVETPVFTHIWPVPLQFWDRSRSV